MLNYQPQSSSSASSSGSSFTHSWPFNFQNSASTYTLSSSSQLYIGDNGSSKEVVRLVSADQTDNSTKGYGGSDGGTYLGGALWDSTNSYVRLSTSSPNLEMSSDWTPSWSGLVGYWKLNESSGAATVADSSPVGTNTGTPTSSVTMGSTGKIGTGANFNTTASQGIRINTTLNFGTGDFTVMAWVNTTQASGLNIWPGIFSKDDNNGGSRILFNLYLSNSNIVNAPSLAVASGGSGARADATTAVNDGQWHHVAGVRQGTTLSIYVDGTLQGSTTGAGVGVDLTNSVNLCIGGRDDSSTQWKYTGNIDEAAIWTTALSASAISTIYNHQVAKYAGIFTSRVMDSLSTGQSWTSLAWTPTLPFFKSLPDSGTSETQTNYTSLYSNSLLTSLKVLYHFEEATGTSGSSSVIDKSGSNNHGTPTAVTFGRSGLLNNTAEFNGTPSYVDAPDLSGTLTGSYSVGAWVKFKSTSGNNKIFHTQNATEVNIDTTGGPFQCYTNAAGSGNNILSTGVTPIAGVWYHVLSVIDNTNKIKYCYINGKLRNSASTTVAIAWPSSSLRIGARTNGNEPVNGLIDEFAVWGRALDSTEAAQLYRRGANRVRFQVRTCSDNTCTTGSPSWKGPDGTDQSYFSEVYNTTSNSLSNAVLATLPTMTFSNFGSLSLSTNRYVQYRTIMESDDMNTLCNYGSGATACSPELKNVSLGPAHYSTDSPSVLSNNGASFSTLSTFTETLGASCSSGIGYNLSLDKTTWYYWTGSAWGVANGTVTQSNNATVLNTNFSAFATQIGTGSLYVKAFLKSSGSTACELDSIDVAGGR